jgi:hypothetical protein
VLGLQFGRFFSLTHLVTLPPNLFRDHNIGPQSLGYEEEGRLKNDLKIEGRYIDLIIMGKQFQPAPCQ